MYALVAESARVARASRVVSGLIAVLAFAVPVAAIGVAGRSIEAQAAILARVDDVGARIITVASTGSAVIPASAVERIGRIAGVDWVVGLGPVSDVRNRATAGRPTPMRAYRGIRAPVLFSPTSIVETAFVSVQSAQRVGLAGAFGAVDPGDVRVSGWFYAADPLGNLNGFVLMPTADDQFQLDRIVVAVFGVEWVEPLASAIPSMIGNDASTAVTIERSPALLQARDAVADEVARQSRGLVVALLGGSMALAGTVVLAGTLAGRRDFGRRRALGASRRQLTILVTLSTLWPALIGSSLGAGVGWVYLSSQLGQAASWEFPVAIGILTAQALSVASTLPAAHAATRDPLQVLRVP